MCFFGINNFSGFFVMRFYNAFLGQVVELCHHMAFGW